MKYFTILLISCLGACSHQLSMTYNCAPMGATLYETETGTSFGQCPATVHYNVPIHTKVMTLKGITAHWPSGATMSAPKVTAYMSAGYNQSYNFERPSNAPGLKKDEDYASKFVKLRQIQQQEALRAIKQQQLAEQAANEQKSRCLAALSQALLTPTPGGSSSMAFNNGIIAMQQMGCN